MTKKKPVCPLCRSTKIKMIDTDPTWEHDIYECQNCGREFKIYSKNWRKRL